MKRYADRERGEVEEYGVGNLVLFNTKNLKYQIVRRHMEKFTECFVGPYKVKAIISSNVISYWTINFGNISDNRNVIIIINGSRERIGFPDITTRSPVMYSKTLSK